jgi:predicted PurR-regulated permease PerM
VALKTEFTADQKRALGIFTVLALVGGAYFLSGYFILIVMAAVTAYLFTPLFTRFTRRFSAGRSAAFTLVVALAVVIIPLTLVILLAIAQVTRMVSNVASWAATANPGALGEQALEFVNRTLARVPYLHTTVTAESLKHIITTVGQNAGRWLLHLLRDAAGSAFGVITASIIFLYVFLALLVHREKVLTLIRQLNPLGEEITDLYLTKIGAMVRGTVEGQFIIAVCQGVAGAASIYLGGFHQGFFILCIFLSAVIPLGSGVVTIPFGIAMMFFGHPIGGTFVVLFHLIGVTNLDNFLRPILVPREARLNPALMLLSVFSGIAVFGFWGIIMGPVLMIIIVTTINVYLAVYRGVEFEDSHDEVPRRKNMFGMKSKTTAPVASE